MELNALNDNVKLILQYTLQGKIKENEIEQLLNNLSEMITEDKEIMIICKEWLINSVPQLVTKCDLNDMVHCKITIIAISMLTTILLLIQSHNHNNQQLYENESNTINAYNDIIKHFIQLFHSHSYNKDKDNNNDNDNDNDNNRSNHTTLRNLFIYHFINFQEAILGYFINIDNNNDIMHYDVDAGADMAFKYSHLYNGWISCVTMYSWTQINHTCRSKLLKLSDIFTHLLINHQTNSNRDNNSDSDREDKTIENESLLSLFKSLLIKDLIMNNNDKESALNVIELCIVTITNWNYANNIIISNINIDHLFQTLRNLLENTFEYSIQQSSPLLITKSLHCIILLHVHCINSNTENDNDNEIERKISEIMDNKLLRKHIKKLSANFMNLYHSPININAFIFTRNHIRYLFYIQMMPMFVFVGKQVDPPVNNIRKQQNESIAAFIRNYRGFLINNLGNGQEENVAPKYLTIDCLRNQDEKIYGLELLMIALDGLNKSPVTRHHESLSITLVCCTLRLLQTMQEISKQIFLSSIPCIHYLLKQTSYHHSMVYSEAIQILSKLMAKYQHDDSDELTDEEKHNILCMSLDIMTDRLHDVRWSIRDTALNLFNHLLIRMHDMFHSHLHSQSKISKIIEIIKCTMASDKDDFVRAQAVDCMRLLYVTCYSCHQCKLLLPNDAKISYVTETLISKFYEETEGIVRRSIIRYLTTLFENNLLPYANDNEELVTKCTEKLMLDACNDFYWQVRLDALHYWQKYIEQSIVHISKKHQVIDTFAKFGQSGCLQAIINTISEDEYDTKVFQYSLLIANQLKCIISQYNITVLHFQQVINTTTTMNQIKLILNKTNVVNDDLIQLNEEKFKLTNRLRRDVLDTMISKLLNQSHYTNVNDTPDCY